MYKFALLLSDEPPLFQALLEDENEPLKGKALRKKMFGVTYDSMKSWANGSGQPSSTTVKTIASTMNNYRKERRQARRHSKRFEASDFKTLSGSSLDASSSDFMPAGQKAEWLDFAAKLGYKPSQWREVQSAIEQVFYRLAVRGHENSCSYKKGELIASDCGGINYIYFVAPPASTDEAGSKPMLVRGTLRVRDPIRVLSGKDICYVPCRMKLLTPSREVRSRNTIEYIGKACFQSGFLYITLLDKTSALDYVHLIVSLTKPFGKMYGGIYTSLSGRKEPYSSALVLDNRESLLSHPDRLDRSLILKFMYEMPKIFYEDYNKEPATAISSMTSDNPLEALDKEQKAYIRETLKGSPFVPQIQPFRRQDTES